MRRTYHAASRRHAFHRNMSDRPRSPHAADSSEPASACVFVVRVALVVCASAFLMMALASSRASSLPWNVFTVAQATPAHGDLQKLVVAATGEIAGGASDGSDRIAHDWTLTFTQQEAQDTAVEASPRSACGAARPAARVHT